MVNVTPWSRKCYAIAERNGCFSFLVIAIQRESQAGENSNAKSSVQNKKIISIKELNFMRASIPKGALIVILMSPYTKEQRV